jgi:hypothetical protein
MDEARRDLALKILAELELASRPIPRRELARRCGPFGVKMTTAERRIREALEWLVWQGHPVMSDGSGFALARNPVQFEAGLALREKAVAAEAQKLRRLRAMLHRMRYPQQMQPQSLPFEVAS